MRETNQTKLSKAKTLGWRKAEPDLCFIHRAKVEGFDYGGLALELKKEGVIVFKKDGKISANKHFQEQDEELKKYHNNGFAAKFGVGLKQSLKIIDWYFGLK